MKPHHLHRLIEEHLETAHAKGESEQPKIQPVHCDSIRKLVNHYKQNGVYWTREAGQTFQSMLAVVLSTTSEGGQLGLRVLGPPGSLKSTFAESISMADTYVYPRSTFRGIVSGWHKTGRADQLALKLNGMCLFVKEADTLLQMPNLPQIQSELRDVLGDGVIRSEYRVGKEYEIYTSFSVVLCGTKALRGMDDAILGSRFLDSVIHDPSTPHDRIVDKAVLSQYDTIKNSLTNPNGRTESGKPQAKIKSMIRRLAPQTVGFINYKREQLQESTEFEDPVDGQMEDIKSMGEIVAHCRARVPRSKEGILYRPEKELPTRVSEQLLRVGMFLAIVTQKEPPYRLTKTVMGTVKKIFRDTCYGFPFEVLTLLSREDLTTKQLALLLRLPDTRVFNILQDMRELGTTSFRMVPNSHGKGRRSHYHCLTDEVKELTIKAFR